MFSIKFGWWKTVCTAIALSAAMGIGSPAQTFTTLVSFDGSNGSSPSFVSLIQGTDGNLYGTTAYGGARGGGTVFGMTPSGTLTMLYSFCARTDCSDGRVPLAGVVLGTDGNFYGTTQAGGASHYGTVFKITPGGALITLHSFDRTDGAYPNAPLIQATNGSFYGTTEADGANGYGTVFDHFGRHADHVAQL